MASMNGHHGVVLSLLGAGADVNIATSDVSDVIFQLMTSGHIAVLTGWREGEAKHSNHSTCKY